MCAEANIKKIMSLAARSVIRETPPQKSKKVKRSKQKNSQTKVIKKESSFKDPLWLRSLLVLQKSSGAIAIGMIIAVLSLYAAIVYTQQLWGKEYQKLTTLQSQERSLTATNESIKNNAVDMAEKSGMGLVPLDPQKAIFLTKTTAPQKPKLETKQNKDKRSLQFTPSGY